MKQQRESYEQMQAALKDFLSACQKTAPWISSIETLAGAAFIMADISDDETEGPALLEISGRLEAIAALQVQVQTVLANLPDHPSWPCEGCERWTGLGCNRHIIGGFWE